MQTVTDYGSAIHKMRALHIICNALMRCVDKNVAKTVDDSRHESCRRMTALCAVHEASIDPPQQKRYSCNAAVRGLHLLNAMCACD